MELHHNSTYPPTTTQPPPSPPHSIAFSGAPGDISWMAPAVLILAIAGATALRIATRKKVG